MQGTNDVWRSCELRVARATSADDMKFRQNAHDKRELRQQALLEKHQKLQAVYRSAPRVQRERAEAERKAEMAELVELLEIERQKEERTLAEQREWISMQRADMEHDIVSRHARAHPSGFKVIPRGVNKAFRTTDIEHILGKLEPNAQDMAALEHAFRGLRSICDNNARNCTIAGRLGCEILVEGLSTLACGGNSEGGGGEDPSTAEERTCSATAGIEQGLLLLRNLCSTEDNRLACGRLGVVEFITGVLAASKWDAHMHTVSCTALAALCQSPENRQQAAATGGVVRAVHRAMKQHQQCPSLQREGCCALAALCANEDANVNEMVNDEVVATLVQCVNSYSHFSSFAPQTTAALVLKEAFGVMYTLFVDSPSCRRFAAELMRGGLCAAIVRGMTGNAYDAPVQLSGLQAMHALVVATGREGEIDAMNEFRCAEGGGCALILRAMELHNNVPPIQWRGAVILTSMCSDHHTVTAVGQAGGAKIVVDGMTATLALPPCQEQFARLIHILCTKVTVRSVLLRSKANDVVQRAAALHLSHRGASHLLAKALKALVG